MRPTGNLIIDGIACFASAAIMYTIFTIFYPHKGLSEKDLFVKGCTLGAIHTVRQITADSFNVPVSLDEMLAIEICEDEYKAFKKGGSK